MMSQVSETFVDRQAFAHLKVKLPKAEKPSGTKLSVLRLTNCFLALLQEASCFQMQDL